MDEYDVPLTGFLHASGRTYLFTNLLGDGEPTGLWAYAHVSDNEMLRLLGAQGPDDFDAAVEAALSNRCVTIAAAFDYALDQWTTFDSGAEGSHGLTQRFMKRMNSERAARERGMSTLNRELESLPG